MGQQNCTDGTNSSDKSMGILSSFSLNTTSSSNDQISGCHRLTSGSIAVPWSILTCRIGNRGEESGEFGEFSTTFALVIQFKFGARKSNAEAR
jgi:hypothetical protein